MKNWLSTHRLFRDGLTWKVGAVLIALGCTTILATSALFPRPVGDIVGVAVIVFLLYLVNALSRIRHDLVRRNPGP